VGAVDANHREINDCWFTNVDSVHGKSNFGCLYDPLTPARRSYPYVDAYKFEINLPNVYLIDALTYSSAAWSTSEAKKALPFDVAWSPAPPLDVGVGNFLQITDGGGYLNLPLVNLITNFEIKPSDTLIYGFDFTAPDEGDSYNILQVLEGLNDRMREIHGFEDYFDLSAVTATSCFTTLTKTRKDNTETDRLLTLRIIGLCGYKHNTVRPDFISGFPTTVAAPVLTGKGAAKQWTKSEMTSFVAGYGAFLKFVFFKNFASESSVSKDKITDSHKLQDINKFDFTCLWEPDAPVDILDNYKFREYIDQNGDYPEETKQEPKVYNHTKRKRHHQKHYAKKHILEANG